MGYRGKVYGSSMRPIAAARHYNRAQVSERVECPHCGGQMLAVRLPRLCGLCEDNQRWGLLEMRKDMYRIARGEVPGPVAGKER